MATYLPEDHPVPLSFARRTAATVTVIAVTAVGCGTATELSARQELSNAMGALDDRSTLTVSMSIDATAERLVELAAAEGDELSLEDAELIVGSRVVLTMASPDGGPLEDLAPDATGEFAMDVVTPTGDLASLRYVDEDLFARADVVRLSELGGGPTTLSPEQLGTEGVPGLEFVPALLAGEWVSVDGQELMALGEGFVPQEPAATEPDESQLEALRGRLGDAFDRSVKVTEDGEDAELGDRLLLEASPRRLLEEVPGLLQGLDLADQPGVDEALGELTGDLSSVPDEPATVAVYVRDDVVTGIRLDLGQFDPEGGADGVAVLVRLDRSDDGVEAPADATPVDLATIFQMVMSGMGASMGAGMGSPSA